MVNTEQMKDVISMRGISKRFGEVEVLHDVDFSVRRSEVHALVGENGAGKTTLIKILGGAYQKNKGQISLTDRQINIVEQMVESGKITTGELSDNLGISRQAALKEMNKLVDLGVVKLVGEGRGAHYVLI